MRVGESIGSRLSLRVGCRRWDAGRNACWRSVGMRLSSEGFAKASGRWQKS